MAGLEIRALGGGWDHELFLVGDEWILRFPRRAERVPWLRREIEIMGVVGEALGAKLLVAAEPYLAGRVPEPEQDGPRRFIHNDICPDHLITDPRTGRLTGLIDFTDAMVGETVLDFAGLIGIGGYGFIAQVAGGYDLDLGRGFQAKLEWLCRTLTLTWLAEAAAETPEHIAKLLTWAERAFSDP